jgi:hypothetical protein
MLFLFKCYAASHFGKLVDVCQLQKVSAALISPNPSQLRLYCHEK